jgi:drug/metabolite transporter (DMT)-like permease
VVAVAHAATLVLFVLANKLTTSMNSIFLQNTGPLYVLALSPLLLGERIRRSDLVVMAVMALGLVMFFMEAADPLATAPHPLAGNVLAAVSGLAWALVIVGLRWLGRREGGAGALPAVVTGNLVAAGVCLTAGWPLADGTVVDWAIIGFLGVFQVGLAYVFLTQGLRHAAAFTASILLLIEPVFNPVWSFFIHGEAPGAWAFVGAGVILSATLGKMVMERRSERETQRGRE